MSIDALKWAFELEGIPVAPKFVLVVLANYADSQWSCFPGQELIAQRTGASIDTVQRALKTLEDLGYVEREERRRENGSRTSDRFYIRQAADGQGRKLRPSVVTPQMDPGHTANSPEVTPHVAAPLTKRRNPQIEPSGLNTLDVAFETLDSTFDVAWAHWPKKVERKASLAKFKLAAKRRGIEQLTRDVIEFGNAYTTAGIEPRFVPALSAWLNGERWTDDLPSAQRAPERISNARRNMSTVEHFRQLEQKEIGR